MYGGTNSFLSNGQLNISECDLLYVREEVPGLVDQDIVYVELEHNTCQLLVVSLDHGEDLGLVLAHVEDQMVEQLSNRDVDRCEIDFRELNSHHTAVFWQQKVGIVLVVVQEAALGYQCIVLFVPRY
jgi:hypothetical protein